MSAGKGDTFRPVDGELYRRNYEGICWHSLSRRYQREIDQWDNANPEGQAHKQDRQERRKYFRHANKDNHHDG